MTPNPYLWLLPILPLAAINGFFGRHSVEEGDHGDRTHLLRRGICHGPDSGAGFSSASAPYYLFCRAWFRSYCSKMVPSSPWYKTPLNR